MDRGKGVTPVMGDSTDRGKETRKNLSWFRKENVQCESVGGCSEGHLLERGLGRYAGLDLKESMHH